MSATARTRSVAGALAAGILLTVLALLPGHAGAQDTTKPTPCTGEMLFTDPTGDAAVDPTSLGLLPIDEGLPSQDITGAFLNYKDGVLTANIEVVNLNKDVPSPVDSQGGAYWYVVYTDGAARRFVRAVNDGSADIAYAYGSIDVNSGVYTTEGETKGAFFEGAKGVIQIEVPAAAGAKDGATFKGVIAVADDIVGLDDASGLNNNVDKAPDGGSVTSDSGGAEYVVTACTAAPSVGTTTPPITTELPLKVTKVLDGAKKAKKKKALRVSVSSTEAITGLSVSLKGKSGTGKTYASAKLASLSGTATLKLKLKAKLKAGSYSLVAKGTVGGTPRSTKLAVKVKK